MAEEGWSTASKSKSKSKSKSRHVATGAASARATSEHDVNPPHKRPPHNRKPAASTSRSSSQSTIESGTEGESDGGGSLNTSSGSLTSSRLKDDSEVFAAQAAIIARASRPEHLLPALHRLAELRYPVTSCTPEVHSHDIALLRCVVVGCEAAGGSFSPTDTRRVRPCHVPAIQPSAPPP